MNLFGCVVALFGAIPVSAQEQSERVAAAYGARDDRIRTLKKRMPDLDQASAEEIRKRLRSLDPRNPRDLETFEAVTDVHLVAVTREPDFFYFNLHLLPPQLVRLHPATNSLYDDQGRLVIERVSESVDDEVYRAEFRGLADPKRPQRQFTFPRRILRSLKTLDSEGTTVPQGFPEAARTNYLLLKHYLAPLEDIPRLADVSETLYGLPINLLKLLRYTTITLSTEPGRSYTHGVNAGNTAYPYFAGLGPGTILQDNTASQIRETLVHELMHVVQDILEGQAKPADSVRDDRRRYPLQDSALSGRYEELVALFGDRDAKPDGAWGFVSEYAKENGQEHFGETARACILQPRETADQAKREDDQGHPELQRKIAFVRKLLETPLKPSLHP